MQRNLLTLATVLGLYQGLYYLHLLHITQGWDWLAGSLLSAYYELGRALLVLVLLVLHDPMRGHRGLLIGYLLVSLAFVGIDQYCTAQQALWLHPMLFTMLCCWPRWKPVATSPIQQPTHCAPGGIALPTQQGYLPINNPAARNLRAGKSRKRENQICARAAPLSAYQARLCRHDL